MQIVRDLEQFRKKPAKRLVLAIGNFDGFHRGHQKLLHYTVTQARKFHAIPAVLTFREHPQSVLHPGRKQLRLHSPEQKLFFLAQAGIRLCFLQSFTPSFAKMTPEEFVEKILVRKLHVLEVVMGYDAHFGHRRSGTTGRMHSLSKKHGFLFKRMNPVMLGERPISSSMVRDLLSRGEFEKVEACLGRPISLWGKVVKGKGHGRHLGFPTANLEIHANIQIPIGVYIASARMLSLKPRFQWSLGKWFSGVMNYGKRPTYPASETPRPVLEMYLFHFHRNIYGGTMEVALHKFIRPEKRFSNEEALKTQILRDVDTARSWHATHAGCPA